VKIAFWKKLLSYFIDIRLEKKQSDYSGQLDVILSRVRIALCTKNEMYSYEWETDRFGKQLDRPVDFNNHLIDAMRYGGMMRLSNVATSKGKYIISIK
jgi:hypothetical protein